eukprot:TRINITY_DN12128_c0_g2_i1.p1 TRINITY_DN12128_c0_g2~~TRINITY_DN12128_c0_g2_i1.p1  ORF type:complete len:187 (+),score=16.48 TRINITY_DN12128_c0_g2_i1:197-757(+)
MAAMTDVPVTLVPSTLAPVTLTPGTTAPDGSDDGPGAQNFIIVGAVVGGLFCVVLGALFCVKCIVKGGSTTNEEGKEEDVNTRFPLLAPHDGSPLPLESPSEDVRLVTVPTPQATPPSQPAHTPNPQDRPLERQGSRNTEPDNPELLVRRNVDELLRSRAAAEASAHDRKIMVYQKARRLGVCRSF